MAGTRGLVHSQGPCKASKDPKRGVSGRRKRKRGMRMGVGEKMDAPNREPTPLWSLASPPSARALPGPAAICERDRSSFQKLFLLWDLGLGGDQTQTSREQEEQRPAAWRSVFFLSCRTSHTLTLTLTPPPFSQLSVCFVSLSTHCCCFPCRCCAGERERFWTPRSIPRDFWSLSSWCCRLSPAIIGSVSLILLSPTSTGRAQTTTPSEPDRRRPAPAALHFTRYTTPISRTSSFASIDDCSPALVTMTAENPATSAGHC